MVRLSSRRSRLTALAVKITVEKNPHTIRNIFRLKWFEVSVNIHLRDANHLVVAGALHLDIGVNEQEFFLLYFSIDYFAFILFEFV